MKLHEKEGVALVSFSKQLASLSHLRPARTVNVIFKQAEAGGPEQCEWPSRADRRRREDDINGKVKLREKLHTSFKPSYGT